MPDDATEFKRTIQALLDRYPKSRILAALHETPLRPGPKRKDDTEILIRMGRVMTWHRDLSDDNALAGHGSGNHSRAAHASPRHAVSPRHHTLGSDGSNESYRSQRLRAKSEWRQALHRGNTSAPFQTATQ